MSETLEDLLSYRMVVVGQIHDLSKERDKIEAEILRRSEPELRSLYGIGEGKKTHGTVTLRDEKSGRLYKVHTSKRIKYDKKKMLTIAQEMGWGTAEHVFDISITMSESYYTELQRIAVTDEVASDRLSKIDDAREVIISEPKLV